MQEEFVFRGQRDNEDVLLVVKQNPWVMAKAGFIVLVLAIVAVLSVVFFGASGVSSFAIIGFIILAGIIFLYRWFVWWNGSYILTNQRIIKIDQQSLFHRMVSEAELDRIQDITSEIHGPIQTILNFGTIHIQTASSSTVINLTNVTDPYEIQQKIVKAHKTAKNELPGQIEISDSFEGPGGKTVIR